MSPNIFLKSIDRETNIVKGMHDLNLQVQGFVPRHLIASLHRDCFEQTKSQDCYAGFEGVESLDQWVEGSDNYPTMSMPATP